MEQTRRLARAALVAACALITASCSSDDRAQPSTSSAPAADSRVVAPDAFAVRINEPEVVTINVHVPDEGSIAGTDLTIPFDTISQSSALPADLATPLAVYCRSGNMSADAVRDLEAQGYTDIVELEGGFNAWSQAGRPLEPPS